MEEENCLNKMPSKVGDIEKELSRLSSEIDETGKLLTSLCQKLSPIIREELDNCADAKEEPSLCSFARDLRNKWNQVAINNERIGSLIARIEL